LTLASEPISIYSALTLQEDEVTVPRSRKQKQRKKNLKSPMMTWALVFLTKPLWYYVQ
uniref:Uncharacterized protein n=1 Tax=Moschus moschiferus TaxID=68415 RepID=A0A8C6D143_MOSMO